MQNKRMFKSNETFFLLNVHKNDFIVSCKASVYIACLCFFYIYSFLVFNYCFIFEFFVFAFSTRSLFNSIRFV